MKKKKESKKISFSNLKKKIPFLVGRFYNDMEALLIFLNSPYRNIWLKFIGLKKKEIDSINKIIEIYAKKKIQLEKKNKPKTNKQIIKIEIEVLKTLFKGEILRFKGVSDADSLVIAEKILKVKYPKSIILNMTETDKLVTLTGINTLKNFPTNFLVFDINKDKIIGINLVLK